MVYRVKIGFVPLHRPFFDEDWASEIRDRTINAISKIDMIHLVYPDETTTHRGLVKDESDAEEVIKLFRQEEVDGMLIGTMTFGDELSGARIVEEFKNCPIAIFGTKEPEPLPGGVRRSDSFCGTLSLASALYRRGVKFVFLGEFFPEEDEFRKAIENFARVTAIVKEFTGARIGLIGPRPNTFETATFNEAIMAKLFKQRVVHISLLELTELADELADSDAEIDNTIKDMGRMADISKVPKTSLLKIAKLDVALRRLVEQHRLDGIGIRCWTELQKYYGASPCFVMGRLTQRGVMSACEVDIYGVLTMIIQYAATMKTSPPHFTDWTIRHPKDRNAFLSQHCGNAPPLLSYKPGMPVLTCHWLFGRIVSSEGSWGTAESRLKPGTVTICRLVEYNGEFKMFITKGEALDEDVPFHGSLAWIKVGDLDKVYRTLVEEGFIHHASVIYGDYVEPITQACKLLGIKTVIV
jgi:L-fucose isomerase-like protein